MTLNDTAQVAARPVEPVNKPFAQLYLSEDLRRLKPGIIKTYAAIVATSYVDENKQRVSESTVREIARRGQISDDTARKNLAYLLSNTRLVSVSEAEKSRRLILETGSGPWVSLDIDHPAWSLNPLDFCVYLVLKKFNGPKGCIVTNATISEFLFTTPRNIKDSINALKTIGAIVPHCQTARLNTGNWTQKRRIIIQNRDLWKKQSENQADGVPQKTSPMYLEDAFSGDQNEPQKTSGGAVKSVLGVPQKTSPDLEKDLESEERNPPAQHAHAHTHTRGVGGVGDESAPPSKPNQIDKALTKILKEDFKTGDTEPCNVWGDFVSNLIDFAEIEKKSDVSRIKNTLCKIWRECGPIKREFIDQATRVEKSPTIRNMVGLVISRLNEWKAMDESMREMYSDETSNEVNDRKGGISKLARNLMDRGVPCAKDEHGNMHFSVKKITSHTASGALPKVKNLLHEAMQDLDFECYARNSGDFRKNEHGEWDWIKESAIEKWTESARKHLEKAKKQKAEKPGPSPSIAHKKGRSAAVSRP